MWSRGFPVWEVLLVSRALFGIVSVLVVYLQDVLNSLLTLAASDVSGKYQTLRVILQREWVRKQAAKRSVFNLPWLVKETNQRSQLNRFIRNIGFVLHRSRLAIGIPNTNIWLSQRKVLLLCIFADSIVNSNEPWPVIDLCTRIARLPSHGNGAVWFVWVFSSFLLGNCLRQNKA